MLALNFKIILLFGQHIVKSSALTVFYTSRVHCSFYSLIDKWPIGGVKGIANRCVITYSEWLDLCSGAELCGHQIRRTNRKGQLSYFSYNNNIACPYPNQAKMSNNI